MDKRENMKIKKVFGPEFNGVDFSSHHEMLLRDDDGTLRPMDENYFEATYRGKGVWQILTYGDYIYLIEGENEALVVDTGFGVGNLRKMCQTLTDKPVKRCVITHEHFDHNGGCSYFEKAYMSEICKKAVLRKENMWVAPFTRGIEFPLDYEVETIGDGYEFDLGGRVLKVFSIPDHAAGSICLLDLQNRMLFSGDELGTPAYKMINTSVEQYAENINKLYPYFEDIDICFGGGFVYDNMILFRQKQALDMVLNGYPGVPYNPPKMLPVVEKKGPMIDGRRLHDQVMFTNILSRDKDLKDQFTYGYCTLVYYRDRIHKK